MLILEFPTNITYSGRVTRLFIGTYYSDLHQSHP